SGSSSPPPTPRSVGPGLRRRCRARVGRRRGAVPAPLERTLRRRSLPRLDRWYVCRMPAPLLAARGAPAKGDRGNALVSLLDAWRARRLAELDDVIDTVSAPLAAAHEPIAAGAKELDAVFTTRLDGADATELPHLYDALTNDPKGTMPLRLRA